MNRAMTSENCTTKKWLSVLGVIDVQNFSVLIDIS